MTWHRPRFYRYEVAFPKRLGVVLNSYPGCLVGAALVVGRWAYCVKWSDPS